MTRATYLWAGGGILGIADTALVLAAGGGINTGTFLPGLFGAAACSWAGALYLERPIAVGIHRKWGRQAATFGICVWLVSFVAVQALIWTADVTSKTEDFKWLVVLGAGLRGDELSRTLLRRMETSREYLAGHPECRVIVSGGRGYGETCSEAEAMKRYLVSHGISAERVLLEDRATSTVENLKNSKSILQQNAGAPPWYVGVVTSDFHQYRTKLLAHRVHLQIKTVPAPTPWYLLPNVCLREYFALFKSLLLDMF